MQDKIIILDCGSQYTQLIARRVREHNIYCEIHPYNNIPDLSQAKGIIISGSPFSVYHPDAPQIDKSIFDLPLPILGVCYGAQFITHINGGEVVASKVREYGRAHLSVVVQDNVLFDDISSSSQVWMSHADTINAVPSNFECIASTEDVKYAAFQIQEKQQFGIQFHPEVYHSSEGKKILGNFLFKVCNLKPNWTPKSYIENTVNELKEQLGDDKVVLGLSGGVDSTVAAVLLQKAIGDNLHCIFVNNGLLRKNEFEDVLEAYKQLNLNVKGVDASQLFYDALGGVSEPEQKRKIIGGKFIEVFDKEAQLLENVKWLGQGTIYPDVIESVSVKGPSSTIKSHHNVGGLPETMKLKVVEPLRMLFKDEVRNIGRELGISHEFIGRHPFPGPGLAIRILGDITAEKVKLLQAADNIYIQALKENNLYDKIWQAGTILLPVNSVGVMGDERTYEKAVVLRAVTSTDGMTADWYPFEYDFLAKVSNQIINQVKGINRVTYDISSKPPATIEWE